MSPPVLNRFKKCIYQLVAKDNDIEDKTHSTIGLINK